MKAKPNDSNLILYYNTENGTTLQTITDASGKGHNAKYSTYIYDGGWGLNFQADAIYTPVTDIAEAPNTFEALVCFPKDMAERGGVILGNYDKAGCVSFEVYTKGEPRLYLDGTSVVFDQVSLYTGSPVHIAIVRDAANGKAHCYINGVLKGTKTLTGQGLTDLPAMDVKAAHALGGDFRSGNTEYFKGSIKSVALYSDCLTASQIANNYKNGKPMDRSSLICYYYLAFMSANDAYITDFSGNGYTINK
jgi:hypothetical protein